MKIMISKTPAEQLATLREYFAESLATWMRGIMAGVVPMEGNQEPILGELGLALSKHAAAAILSDPPRADAAIEEDCELMAIDYVGRLIERFQEKRGEWPKTDEAKAIRVRTAEERVLLIAAALAKVVRSPSLIAALADLKAARESVVGGVS